MSNTAEIYLDMDGVCVNFMGAALAANGHSPDEALQRWQADHPGSLFPEELLGKPAMEFFTHDALSEADFWRNLETYPWFEHLYSELSRLGHVVFLTAPTGSPGCVAGKLAWLTDTFGSSYTDYIFTRHKDRLAHDQAYLVDDMPFNITPFEKRAGSGLLFPQTWNELHHIEDPVAEVIQKLEQYLQT